MSTNTMDCTTTAEILPWYLNGSLEPERAAALDAHLATCAACRQEHREAAFAAAAFAVHPEAQDLVDLAFRRPLEISRRQLLEAHLQSCSSCREELTLTEASRDALALLETEGSDAPARQLSQAVPLLRPSSAARRWRSLALAASVVLAVGAGLWLWNWQPQGAAAPLPPAAGQATAGLGSAGTLPGGEGPAQGSLPEGTRLQLLAARPGTLELEGGAGGEPRLHISPDSPSLFLTLVQPRLGSGLKWHGAIFTQEGHRLWLAESLRSENGRLEAMIPAELLLQGSLELRLWNPKTGSSATGATLAFELIFD